MSETKTIGRISLSSRPPEDSGGSPDASAGSTSDTRLARMKEEISRFGENLLAAKERLRDLRVKAAREEAKGTTGPEMGRLYDEIQAGVESLNALEGALQRVIIRARRSGLSESVVQELDGLVREARSARPMGVTVPGGRTIYYYKQPLCDPQSLSESSFDRTLDAVRRVDSYVLGGHGGSARGAGRGPVNFMLPQMTPMFSPGTLVTGAMSTMPSILGISMNPRPLMF